MINLLTGFLQYFRRLRIARLFCGLFLLEIFLLHLILIMSLKDTLMDTVNSNQRPSLVGNKNYKGTVRKGLSYKKYFKYPLDIDMIELSHQIKSENIIDNISVINPHPFSYKMLPRKKCNFSNNTNLTLVIIIKSDIRNFGRRKIIRKTWGNIANLSDVSIVFLLGEHVELSIYEEEKIHGDIVQENFKDTYRNNTIKTIMGFNWAVKYCSNSNFLFFVDDDYFVHVGKLVTFLRQFKNVTHLYLGTLTSRAIPYRNSGSKWDIGWDEYPFDYWPPYIMGGAYLVTMKTAMQFTLVFPYIKPLHIDDAYLGIVAKKLNIPPNRAPGFYAGMKKRKSVSGSILASHGYGNSTDVLAMWNLLKEKY